MIDPRTATQPGDVSGSIAKVSFASQLGEPFPKACTAEGFSIGANICSLYS